MELSGQYIGKFQVKIGYGKATPTTRIWVGGLGPWTSLAQLEREFDRFGAIKKIDYNAKNGDSHAYILYETIEAAQAAVQDMRGFCLGGPDRRLKTDFVDTNPPSGAAAAGSSASGACPSSSTDGVFHGTDLLTLWLFAGSAAAPSSSSSKSKSAGYGDAADVDWNNGEPSDSGGAYRSGGSHRKSERGRSSYDKRSSGGGYRGSTSSSAAAAAASEGGGGGGAADWPAGRGASADEADATAGARGASGDDADDDGRVLLVAPLGIFFECSTIAKYFFIVPSCWPFLKPSFVVE